MRNQPARAAFLDGRGPVLGRVHDVVLESMISRFKNASLIPSLLTWFWLLFLICSWFMCGANHQ